MAWEERISKKIITWACWPQLGVPQWDPASQSCRWLSEGWNWPWKQRCPPQWQTGARGGLSYLTWEVIFAPQIRFVLEVYKIWTHTQKKKTTTKTQTQQNIQKPIWRGVERFIKILKYSDISAVFQKVNASSMLFWKISQHQSVTTR